MSGVLHRFFGKMQTVQHFAFMIDIRLGSIDVLGLTFIATRSYSRRVTNDSSQYVANRKHDAITETVIVRTISR